MLGFCHTASWHAERGKATFLCTLHDFGLEAWGLLIR
jgi:hypothetical protein